MSRRWFPFIFIALTVAVIFGHSTALLVLWLILTAGYAVSVVIHPRARCLHCSGTGELRGGLFLWGFRRCPQCQGGRIVRAGASRIGLPHVRAQAQAIRQQQRRTRFWQRW